MPFLFALLLALCSAQAVPCLKPVAPASGYRAARIQVRQQQALPVIAPETFEFTAYQAPSFPTYSPISAWAERAVAFQIPPPASSL